MRSFTASLLSIALAASAISAETVAWKIPLSQIAHDGIETAGVTKLMKPPGESVFFRKGDVLWDLAKVLRKDAKPAAAPDWVVWNSTSKRIVAKGSLSSVWALHRLLGYENIPTQCRLRIDASKVPADGSSPDLDKKADSSLELIVKSGQKGEASISENGSTLRFSGSPISSEDKSLIDLDLEISSFLPDGPSLKLNTAVALKNGSSVWLARESDGDTGTDVVITATVELADGTPFSESAFREIAGAAVPLVSPRVASGFVAIEDKRWLSWVGFGGEILHSAVLSNQEDVDQNVDPFAYTSTQERPPLGGFPEIDLPPELVPFFGGSAFDVSKELKAMGIIVGGDEIAGYDPSTERIFLYSGNATEIDKLTSVFMTFCYDPPTTIEIGLQSRGLTKILGRSGHKITLEATRTDPSRERIFEMEPTVGENDDLVDLRIRFDEIAGEAPVRSLNTSVTLVVSEPLELMKGRSDPPLEITVGLTRGE